MIKSILTLVSSHDTCKTKRFENKIFQLYMYVLNVESEYSEIE